MHAVVVNYNDKLMNCRPDTTILNLYVKERHICLQRVTQIELDNEVRKKQ